MNHHTACCCICLLSPCLIIWFLDLIMVHFAHFEGRWLLRLLEVGCWMLHMFTRGKGPIHLQDWDTCHYFPEAQIMSGSFSQWGKTNLSFVVKREWSMKANGQSTIYFHLQPGAVSNDQDQRYKVQKWASSEGCMRSTLEIKWGAHSSGWTLCLGSSGTNTTRSGPEVDHHLTRMNYSKVKGFRLVLPGGPTDWRDYVPPI